MNTHNKDINVIVRIHYSNRQSYCHRQMSKGICVVLT